MSKNLTFQEAIDLADSVSAKIETAIEAKARANIDLTRCPTCGNKWHACTCPPLYEAVFDIERAEYERRIAALEARVADLERRLDEQDGGK